MNASSPPKKMWRKYKGTSAEELCAATRELWLAKYPNYIRMLDKVPNRLIEDIATIYASRPNGLPEEVGWPTKYDGRRELRELERFLDTQPFGDHFSDDLLEDELYWKDPDAPLIDYISADKKKDALINKYSVVRKQESAQ